MIIVSDTSPILNLAVIGQLHLLPKLYGTVVVPQAVYTEIVIRGTGQIGAMEVAQANWIECKQIANRPLVTSLEGELDIGEAEAIVLAVELKDVLLLIDERKGRIVANRLGVNSIYITVFCKPLVRAQWTTSNKMIKLAELSDNRETTQLFVSQHPAKTSTNKFKKAS